MDEPTDEPISSTEPPAGISRELYRDLERRARALLGRRRVQWTPETDSLVNQACAKLLRSVGPPPEDRTRFLVFAAATLRNVLVDLARQRGALRHGGGRDHDVFDEQRIAQRSDEDGAALVLDVDEKLQKLAQHDPWLSRLVELRFFGEMTWPEIAAASGKSASEVQKDWDFVRVWMRSELSDPRERPAR